jgi:NAD(P)-dependent dehydrogenase (short-subunit alcohol dehydrogenase family)
MASLAGQHAVVTGGGRGIGRATAAALLQAGAKVTVIGRGEAALQDAVQQRHATAFAVADVTNEQALAEQIARSVAAHGPVDILVANAGGTGSAPFGQTSPAQFREIFDLNVMGVVHAVRAVLDGMIARKSGRIVAMASTASLKGYAYVSAYCAAKHAVLGLVRSLAIETARTGVTVNAVCPGFADTEIMQEAVATISQKTGRSSADAVSSILKGTPIGRFVKPEEVAAAVLYLCSPEAAAVTGSALTVAGGEI